MIDRVTSTAAFGLQFRVRASRLLQGEPLAGCRTVRRRRRFLGVDPGKPVGAAGRRHCGCRDPPCRSDGVRSLRAAPGADSSGRTTGSALDPTYPTGVPRPDFVARCRTSSSRGRAHRSATASLTCIRITRSGVPGRQVLPGRLAIQGFARHREGASAPALTRGRAGAGRFSGGRQPADR